MGNHLQGVILGVNASPNGLVGGLKPPEKSKSSKNADFPIISYFYTAERRLFPCSIAEGIPIILLLYSLKNKKG
jgi:hypothetical protein